MAPTYQYGVQRRGMDDPNVVNMAQTGGGRYAQSPEAAELTRATLAGDYLTESNPYLDDVIAAANRDTTQAAEGQMANLARASLRPGGMGSSVWGSQRQGLQDAMAQRLADASTGARAQVYESERGRQNEVLGLSGQREQAIWGNDTSRANAQTSANASRAAAGASNAASMRNAQLAARAQEAQIRSNLLLGQGDLAERARQFDARQPMDWAQILGGQIGQYGAQSNANLGQLGGLIGQQMGFQQGAAGLGLQGQGQALQAAGMLPGFEQAGYLGQGQAADYLASLYGSQTGLQGAQAAAGASRFGTQAGIDQMGYQSAMDQWRYNNPQSALQDFTSMLPTYGGLAGGQSTGYGVGGPAPGPVAPGQQDQTLDYLATAAGIAMMFGV